MALGTHEIPVLIQLGPVQDIVVFDLFVWIQMKPALTTLLLWPSVPCKRERLHATIWKLNQILLQRIHAKGVLDFKGCELPIRVVGFNEELSISFEKPRVHIIVIEARVIKIAQHRLRRGMLHGVLVLRGLPEICFRPMASRADLASDEGRRRERSRVESFHRLVFKQQENENSRNDEA